MRCRLLDQAIAHVKGSLKVEVKAEDLRLMLGLADRGRIIDLFREVMRGDIAAALASLKALYEAGADPARILGELAEFVHFVTRLKLAPETPQDPAVTEDERRRGAEFAEKLSIPVLSRAWQLLLKGLQDVRDLQRPLAAADMVLVRLAYAADLPTPDEALRRLAQQAPVAARGASAAHRRAGRRNKRHPRKPRRGGTQAVRTTSLGGSAAPPQPFRRYRRASRRDSAISS